MVGAEAHIFRTVWHPAHFVNGTLVGSAFDREDLIGEPHNGEPRYVSVDRQDGISKASVDWRIDRQT